VPCSNTKNTRGVVVRGRSCLRIFFFDLDGLEPLQKRETIPGSDQEYFKSPLGLFSHRRRSFVVNRNKKAEGYQRGTFIAYLIPEELTGNDGQGPRDPLVPWNHIWADAWMMGLEE
jgi:hypothetical protein